MFYGHYDNHRMDTMISNHILSAGGKGLDQQIHESRTISYMGGV
jgi:hypothetical protein